MRWHRTVWTDLALRLAGVVLLLFMVATARALFGVAPHESRGIDFLWAILTFVSGSGGCILLVFGAHLFDRIPAPGRWQVDDPANAAPAVR